MKTDEAFRAKALAELDGVSGGASVPVCDCPPATPRFACFIVT